MLQNSELVQSSGDLRGLGDVYHFTVLSLATPVAVSSYHCLYSVRRDGQHMRSWVLSRYPVYNPSRSLEIVVGDQYGLRIATQSTAYGLSSTRCGIKHWF